MSLLEGLVGQGGESGHREQLPPHEVPLLVLVPSQVGVLHRETIPTSYRSQRKEGGGQVLCILGICVKDRSVNRQLSSLYNYIPCTVQCTQNLLHDFTGAGQQRRW